MNDMQPSNDSSEVLYEIQVQLYDQSSSQTTPGSSASNSKRDSIKSSNSNDILENSKGDETGQYVEGWIIYRTYKQFESLHNILSEINPYIKNDFKKVVNLKPSALIKSDNETKIKQSIASLDNYLKVRNFLHNYFLIINKKTRFQDQNRRFVPIDSLQGSHVSSVTSFLYVFLSKSGAFER